MAYQTEGTQLIFRTRPGGCLRRSARPSSWMILLSVASWSSAMLDSTQIDNIIVAAMARETRKAEVERRAKWAAILANAAEFSAAVGN
jgi:hypothetical protein